MKINEIILESFPGKNKSKIYNFLINTIDSGPFDGGCIIFARALQIIYGGEIFILVGSSGQAEHAVLMLDDNFIDADGKLPIKQAIKRFENNELVKIIGYRKIQKNDLPNTPRNEQISAQIAKLLK